MQRENKYSISNFICIASISSKACRHKIYGIYLYLFNTFFYLLYHINWTIHFCRIKNKYSKVSCAIFLLSYIYFYIVAIADRDFLILLTLLYIGEVYFLFY